MFNWQIDFGNIIAIITFVFALWKVRKADLEKMRIQHEDNVKLLTAMNTKLDLMWNWFSKNQIGRHD